MIRKLKPGQSGTKKLADQYGDRLVCVRYRYDALTRKCVKTVELIVEESDWQPPAPRLSAAGRNDYSGLLSEAATQHDDRWLAGQLRSNRRLNSTETRRTPKGGITTVQVPVTAADTLAEGEFNRFYIRALCRRAIDSGSSKVTVYRAKQVERARTESERKIGSQVDAQALLSDLRSHQGVDTALGLPPGPNSGLSVQL